MKHQYGREMDALDAAVTVVYEHQFTISAAHFNGGEAYRKYYLVRDGALEGDDAVIALESVLADIHGHNFKITVTASSEMPEEGPYSIDDVKLSDVVFAWQNENLSVHEDFLTNRWRATTEMMARVLKNKLEVLDPLIEWSVVVRETAEISAAI